MQNKSVERGRAKPCHFCNYCFSAGCGHYLEFRQSLPGPSLPRWSQLIMNEFTTIFEITAGTNGIRADVIFRLVIGIVILIAGITGLILRKKTRGLFPKKLWGPVFMTFWGVMWLLLHIPLWRIGTSDIEQLLDVFRNGQCQIAEGVVHVTHEQPFGGHSAGDVITVGGQEFEINYFHVTPGYKQTNSHGGALREGVFARLHYHNGVILKIEIGKKRMANNLLQVSA